MARRHRHHSYARGFFLSAASLLMLFAASAIPIPLYAEYRTLIGLSDADIASATTVFLAGIVVILFFAGKLSDAMGRRPLTGVALGLGALGCILFAYVANPLMLMTARFLQGIACGIGMSAVSTFMIDSAGERYRVPATTLASTGSLVGITVGSLFIGVLRMITTNWNIAFAGCGIILIALLALLPTTVETVVHPSPIRAALKPMLSIDKSIRSVFPVAICSYAAMWAIATYYQSFSAPVAVDCFGNTNELVASAVLALAMAPSAIGGPIEARMPSGHSLRIGVIAFVISVIGLCFTTTFQLLIPFFVFLTFSSITQGICLSGSLRLTLNVAKDISTAGVVSSINLLAYLSATLCSSLMSATIPSIGLFGTLALMGFIALPLCGYIFWKAKRVA